MQAARLASRLQRELRMLQTDPPPGVCAWPCNDSLSHLEAQIQGPEATVYAKGIFTLEVRVPERYPFEPPNVKFRTPIYHPNIDSGGRICLDILNMPPKGAWKPSLNIPAILASIGLLLAEPNPDDGLMGDITAEYKHDRESFDSKAQKWTAQYAVQNPPEDGAPHTRNHSQPEPAEPKAHPLQPIGKAPHSLQTHEAASSVVSSEQRRRNVLQDVSNAIAEKQQCASKLDHFRSPGSLNHQKPNLSMRLRKGGGKGSEGDKAEDTAGGVGDAVRPQSRVLESSDAAHPGARQGQDKLPDGLTSIAEDVHLRITTSETADLSGPPSSSTGPAASMREGSAIDSKGVTGVCPIPGKGAESQGLFHSSKPCALTSIDLNKLKRPRESKGVVASAEIEDVQLLNPKMPSMLEGGSRAASSGSFSSEKKMTRAPRQISDHSSQLLSVSENDAGRSGSQSTTTKGTLGKSPREHVDSVNAPLKFNFDIPQTSKRHPRDNSESLHGQQALTTQNEKRFSSLARTTEGETSSQVAGEILIEKQGNTSIRDGSITVAPAEDLRLPSGRKGENCVPVFQNGTTVTNSTLSETQTGPGPRINISGKSNSGPTVSQERPNRLNAVLSDVKITSISERATSDPVRPSTASGGHAVASVPANAEPFSTFRKSEATSTGIGSRVECRTKAQQINTAPLIVLDSESDEEPPKGRSRLSLACRKSKKRK